MELTDLTWHEYEKNAKAMDSQKDNPGESEKDRHPDKEVKSEVDEDEIELYVPSLSSFIPPDGGYGWVIVISAFSVQFVVLGTMNNFGILFTQLLEEFKGTKEETAWVGSINYGLMFLTGPIATSAAERIGCRPVAMIGAFIAVVATLLASFSTSLYKMYLTEGFLFGIGASLCYFPSIIILPQYFYKHLSLVTGIASCGSGLGTMAMAPIMNYVIKTYGWRNSIRLSTVLLFICCLISLLYQPNKNLEKLIKERQKEYRPPLCDLSVFQNKGFVMLTVAMSIFMLAYFVPFVHLTQMALEYDIKIEKASLLVGLMSVSSTFGRIFFGKIADFECVNRLYMFQICLLGMGVANTICPLLRSFTGLVFYCGVFGFFEAGYVCQVPVICADIVGLNRMAPALGILFGIKSIPLTLGPPFAGFLYDISNSYQVAFYVAGAMPTIASIVMFAVPFLIPPKDHPFWNNQPPSSQQELMKGETSADHGDIDDYTNNNVEKCGSFISDADYVDRPPRHNRYQFATRDTRSYSSLASYHLAPERRISMREIGSISSFGSVIFSPVPPPAAVQANIQGSRHLLVVDKVTNV